MIWMLTENLLAISVYLNACMLVVTYAYWLEAQKWRSRYEELRLKVKNEAVEAALFGAGMEMFSRISDRLGL